MLKYFIFLSSIFLSSCQDKIQPTDNSSKSIQEQYLDLVNSTRAEGRKCGSEFFKAAGAVTWNSSLEKAALYHSKDMFDNKYFAHISPKGDDPSSRVLAQNYNFKSIAENIYSATGFTPTPAEIITQWTNSPTHCPNIMNPNFKEMAVGKYENYWTQLFGLK